MPESRDRLSRPVDVALIFARWRAGIISVLDEEVESALFGSTPRRQSIASIVTRGATGLGSARGGAAVRGSFGTARNVFGRGRGRNLYRTPAAGAENTPLGTARRERGRTLQSVLPSWYPRIPLRDITADVRAIERRRARLGETEGLTGSPFPSYQLLPDASMSVSGAQLEYDPSLFSNPTVGDKLKTPAGSKVPKILLDITKQSEGESEFRTPQKRLLDSIDTVEKVVREELQKLKRTPTAKKAEREKRVRTLMSMR